MTIFALQIKCDLENITKLTSRPSTVYKITIKNPLNDYEVREGITICSDDTVEMENEHVGDQHFAIRWEGQPKFSTLRIMDGKEKALQGKKKMPSNAPTPLIASDTWTNILAIETRGLEPTSWTLGLDEFIVESTGGTVYNEEVDFSDDWCEYCEKIGESVGVSNFESRWVVV